MLLRDPLMERLGQNNEQPRGEVSQRDEFSDDGDLVVNTADVARKMAPSRAATNTIAPPASPRTRGRPIPATATSDRAPRPVLLSTPFRAVAAAPPEKSAPSRPPPPSRPPRHRTTGSSLKMMWPTEVPSETIIEMDIELDPNGDDVERNLPEWAEFLKYQQVVESPPPKPAGAPPRLPLGGSTSSPPRAENSERPEYGRTYDRDREAIYGKLPRKPPVQYAVPSIGREVAPPTSQSRPVPSSRGRRGGYNAYSGYYKQVAKEKNGIARDVRKDVEAPQTVARETLPSAPAEMCAPEVDQLAEISPWAEYEYVPYDKQAIVSEFESAGLERGEDRSWTVQPQKSCSGPWTVQPWGTSVAAGDAAEEYLEGRGGISWERGDELEDLPGGSSGRAWRGHEERTAERRESFAEEDGSEGSSSYENDDERYSTTHREDYDGQSGRGERSVEGGQSSRRGSEDDRGSPRAGSSRRRRGRSFDSEERGESAEGGRRSGRMRDGSDSRADDTSEDGYYTDSSSGSRSRNRRYRRRSRSSSSVTSSSSYSDGSWYSRDGSDSGGRRDDSPRRNGTVEGTSGEVAAGQGQVAGSLQPSRTVEGPRPCREDFNPYRTVGNHATGRQPEWVDKIRPGQPDGVLPSYNQSKEELGKEKEDTWLPSFCRDLGLMTDTVKPSEIMGFLNPRRPTPQPSAAAAAPPDSLEDAPPATPTRATYPEGPSSSSSSSSGGVMTSGGGIKKEWVAGVFKWIEKLDGVWFLRGNAATVMKFNFKPVDALADEKGRFMALHQEGMCQDAGYLMLREPEPRHLNNYFYTDLVSLEDLRSTVAKGASWQLTEGCFNSNFETLTFVRASDDSQGGGTRWLVFDRKPRGKGDAPERQEDRCAKQIFTPEEPKVRQPEETHHGDWDNWEKSKIYGGEWYWKNEGGESEAGGRQSKWKNNRGGGGGGWGREWKQGEARHNPVVVDWSRIEYHPDWRRFTGEWYGFKQYGKGPRPSFKSCELPGPHKDDHYIDMATILFVYGFPRSYSEDDLKEAFSKFGEVQEAKVKCKRGRRDYAGAGYGWIRYATREECERCISATDRKMTFQGMHYPAKVRPAMEKDFHFEFKDRLFPEDLAKRPGYWLKVLNNIEYFAKDYSKIFELRVFGKTVLEYRVGARTAVLFEPLVNKHVAIFAMNLFLENAVDCRLDNYHSVGESDENYQVYKNFSRRGATNSEPYKPGMKLDLSPCMNEDLKSATTLTKVMEKYISEKRYKIECRVDGWQA
ncbi:hypothetical protein FOZ63_031464 [Perkinsus olseni]|uniref:RRM domain-containing protein n=1 Tax=Perkinsus olseni TaxID=32597 RepID=A0A7J6Q9P1_PEROL|nr:hypothetical protein FOZ63_031464 [Perkinsus olseni]